MTEKIKQKHEPKAKDQAICLRQLLWLDNRNVVERLSMHLAHCLLTQRLLNLVQCYLDAFYTLNTLDHFIGCLMMCECVYVKRMRNDRG
jgi:hypothetical protein